MFGIYAIKQFVAVFVFLFVLYFRQFCMYRADLLYLCLGVRWDHIETIIPLDVGILQKNLCGHLT